MQLNTLCMLCLTSHFILTAHSKISEVKSKIRHEMQFIQ